METAKQPPLSKADKEKLKSIAECVFASNCVVMGEETIIQALCEHYKAIRLNRERAKNGIRKMLDSGLIVKYESEFMLNPEIFLD